MEPVQTVEVSVPPVAPFDRVGFSKRFPAAVIDVILSVVTGGVVGLVTGGFLGGLLGTLGGGVALGGAGAFVGSLGGIVVGAMLGGLLYALIEALTGASPGKRIVGIRIRNADGSEAPRQQLFVRYAAKNAATLLSIIGSFTGIDLFTGLGSAAGVIVFFGFFGIFMSSRQTLHDMAAGTAVYSA